MRGGIPTTLSMFTFTRNILMNRFCVVIVLVLVLMTGGKAQESSDIEFSVSSGYVLPSSPMAFANYWKMQYSLGAGVGWALSPSIKLIGSVEYCQFKLSEDGVSEAFNTEYVRDIWIFEDVSMDPSADPSSMLNIAASVRVTPSGIPGIVSPYLIAGGGLMTFTLSEVSMPATSVVKLSSSTVSMTSEQKIVGGTETAGFIQGGLGFEFGLSAMFKPYVEARYVVGFTKGVSTSTIPLTVGVWMRF
jgi:hypothetical protein